MAAGEEGMWHDWNYTETRVALRPKVWNESMVC